MTPCPSHADLERFCGSSLPPDRLAEIETHVGECPNCSAALDRLGREAIRGLPLDVVCDPPPEPPGYTVGRRLGAGGMGVVYEARQEALGRMVALKVVSAGWTADPAAGARFLAEAEAMASIRHPNVVQVFDAGRHAGRPFLAMELLTGALSPSASRAAGSTRGPPPR